MHYYDQHVHSKYSADSSASLSVYIRKAIREGFSHFVVTDHIDLNYRAIGEHNICDIEKRHKEMVKLQKEYPNITLLEGIELGYDENEIPWLKEFANNKLLDIVNLSVHIYNCESFYYKEMYKEDARKTVNFYLSLIYDAINSGIDFDVLCHFDYAFRTAHEVDSSLKILDFREMLEKIFKCLIDKDKSLELNVKVQKLINDDQHVLDFLGLYKSLGGKNLTISSDAHKVSKLARKCDKYIALAKQAGFNEVCCYIKRKKYNVGIMKMKRRYI